VARGWRRFASAALLILSSGIPARAQTTPVWPEVDAYVTLNDKVRFFFLATTVQENGVSTEGEFGVNVDLHVKPIRQRTPALLFRLDESKNRLLLVRAGYRYLPSYTGGPNENRGVLEVTPRYPLIGLLGDVLISDRNRVDFRLIEGEHSWRYRNRLSAERELSLGRVRVGPYARFELYYDSRFDKWSRGEWMLGSSFPITRHWEVEAYYDSQNDTSESPNRHTRALGVVTTFYF
jgi:Protein of unknown function (DUF2490)